MTSARNAVWAWSAGLCLVTMLHVPAAGPRDTNSPVAPPVPSAVAPSPPPSALSPGEGQERLRPSEGEQVHVPDSRPPPEAEPLHGPSLTHLAVRPVANGVFELGAVRLDARRRTVTFPARVNLTRGALEYLLVNARGKTHESLLVTEVEPLHVHLARLLISRPHPPAAVTNAPPALSLPTGIPAELTHARPATNPPLPGFITTPAAELPPGEPVEIRLTWDFQGLARQAAADELIHNLQTQSPMRPGPWRYTGSRIAQGGFTAQRERSIIALVTDPDALINNPRPGHDNDEIWVVNEARTPPAGTLVYVTLEFAPDAPAPPP